MTGAQHDLEAGAKRFVLLPSGHARVQLGRDASPRHSEPPVLDQVVERRSAGVRLSMIGVSLSHPVDIVSVADSNATEKFQYLHVGDGAGGTARARRTLERRSQHATEAVAQDASRLVGRVGEALEPNHGCECTSRWPGRPQLEETQGQTMSPATTRDGRARYSPAFAKSRRSAAPS